VGMILNISLTRADSSTCSPNIVLVSQDPIKATPGSYVKVVFELSNLYNCYNGLGVKLTTPYPFSLDNGTNPVQTIASLPYVSGSYQTTWDVGYTVRIADDAANQNYTLPLLFHIGTSPDFSNSAENDFNINIINEMTNFDSVIQSVSGTQVAIGIANVGENPANAVIVKIPTQSNFRAVGTSGQIIGNLQSGDYTIVNFNLASTRTFSGTGATGANTQRPTNVQPSNSSSNQLQFEIDYTDNTGVRRIVNMQLPLVVTNSSITGSFAGRTQRSSWSIWYTILIIVGVLVILFITYKKSSKFKKSVNKIFKRKKQESNSQSTELPDWIKKEMEKGKKK